MGEEILKDGFLMLLVVSGLDDHLFSVKSLSTLNFAAEEVLSKITEVQNSKATVRLKPNHKHADRYGLSCHIDQAHLRQL
jgi:hypothetical protein